MTKKRRNALPVILGAWAAFCVGFALLGLQLRAGNDPALGAPPAPAAARPEHKVVVRRVIRKVVVDGPTTLAAAPSTATAPAAAAPAASAPAPAAPAPAPAAPAPVTTRSS
jgi:2-oxoglutarate dehydrogenase E2 component (dihydrolipoamide succinyltransferase)